MNSDSPIQSNPEPIPPQRMSPQDSDRILRPTVSVSHIRTSIDSSNMNGGRIDVASSEWIVVW